MPERDLSALNLVLPDMRLPLNKKVLEEGAEAEKEKDGETQDVPECPDGSCPICPDFRKLMQARAKDVQKE